MLKIGVPEKGGNCAKVPQILSYSLGCMWTSFRIAGIGRQCVRFWAESSHWFANSSRTARARWRSQWVHGPSSTSQATLPRGKRILGCGQTWLSLNGRVFLGVPRVWWFLPFCGSPRKHPHKKYVSKRKGLISRSPQYLVGLYVRAKPGKLASWWSPRMAFQRGIKATAVRSSPPLGKCCQAFSVGLRVRIFKGFADGFLPLRTL